MNKSEEAAARARLTTFRAYYETWALANGGRDFNDLTIAEAELAAGMFSAGLHAASDFMWNWGDAKSSDKLRSAADGTIAYPAAEGHPVRPAYRG